MLNTQNSSPTQNQPASHWQILGEFELEAEAFADDTFRARLKETLDPLALVEEFLNRILGAAQQTAARLLRADAEIKLEHIHLRVYVPSNRTAHKQTWGFFSVEKLEGAKEGAVINAHTLEIYLYVEGNPIPVHGNK